MSYERHEEFRIVDRITASKGRLERFLDDQERSPWCDSTLYMTASDLAAAAERREQSVIGIEPRLDIIQRAVAGSETGAVVFLGESNAVAIMPPFPLVETREAPGVITEPLRDLLAREFTVAVVLLRLGRYAVGVVRGADLIASKTDTRYVKNRHRAGGSSQRRFERSRERLIREIFDKACEVSRDVLTPHEASIDYLMLGGERNTLRGLMERCAYLSGYGDRMLQRTLAVERPNLEALKGISREIWTSRILIFESRLD
jgi:hypothetical protein